MRSPPAFGHLDADCFYVSAERVRNQFLQGKPVGVLGNQGAAVIAKSYEMKAAGVTTGMPIWDQCHKLRGVYCGGKCLVREWLRRFAASAAYEFLRGWRS